ncbi:porin [Komagataeibacter saccharivorans]|uniref:MIP/aquaporin family protein n=1 Tax=Komagataeibacter saccharivorans TaxID=265959 RepID=UPI000D7CF573|nr:aquaporin [Komagataeibacter saccharivorans]PYD50598.1 porin [Komagataeibacter saccharivorans]GBQ36485.1 major facilitator superfamily glycerol uptake transporter [Komagataeibacter saccharivorans NRIC 0614]
MRLPHLHLPYLHIHVHDRPLAGDPHPHNPFHWKLYFCEAVATAVLMILGLSAVILLTAPGSPLSAPLLHHPYIQTALCGLCFGLSGTAAAMTPFGKVSGAHINPSVTLAFSLAKRIGGIDALNYMIAQVIGAFLGTAMVYEAGKLVAWWGNMAVAVHYGATVPYEHISIWWAMWSEMFVTAALIAMLYWLAAHPRWKFITPWSGGLFFLVMNPITAWLSGNSVNFARTLAPALFAGEWAGLWVYVVGPFAGASLAVMAIRMNLLGKLHLLEARLVNFGHHGRVPGLDDPHRKLNHPDDHLHIPPASEPAGEGTAPGATHV